MKKIGRFIFEQWNRLDIFYMYVIAWVIGTSLGLLIFYFLYKIVSQLSK